MARPLLFSWRRKRVTLTHSRESSRRLQSVDEVLGMESRNQYAIHFTAASVPSSQYTPELFFQTSPGASSNRIPVSTQSLKCKNHPAAQPPFMHSHHKRPISYQPILPSAPTPNPNLTQTQNPKQNPRTYPHMCAFQISRRSTHAVTALRVRGSDVSSHILAAHHSVAQAVIWAPLPFCNQAGKLPDLHVGVTSYLTPSERRKTRPLNYVGAYPVDASCRGWFFESFLASPESHLHCWYCKL